MLKRERKQKGISKTAIIISFIIIICFLIFFALILNSIQTITISEIISHENLVTSSNNNSINIDDKQDAENINKETQNDENNNNHTSVERQNEYVKSNTNYNDKYDKNAAYYSDIHNYADPRLISTLSSPLYDTQFPLVSADPEKANAVKEAFLHAYNSYKKYCWMHDELKPITRKCKDTLNAGLTIVDSITTLYIMNLTNEYIEAREFIAKEFKPNGRWSLFEFIIRFVGGFISIYQLSNDKIFLDKAVQCTDAILPLFDKQNGFYTSGFTLNTDSKGKITASAPSAHKKNYNLAEIGTYQIEFLTLTALTGDTKYMDLALKVYQKLWKDNPKYSILNSAKENQLGDNKPRKGKILPRHLGAGADSYFEYIIKSYILTNGVSPRILKQHMKIVQEMRDTLLFNTKNLKLTGMGVLKDKNLLPIIEHLATFVPGMVAIGTVKNNNKKKEDLKLAREIVDTISYVMNETIAKLMPERVLFNVNDDEMEKEFKIMKNEYLLRPESVESIFYLFRFTGEQKYRDIAWNFFIGINNSCRVKNGFVSVKGLDGSISHIDIMDSWFLAETLNYLYLTFTDTRLISPAEWVFNTESHPLHVWPKGTSEKYEKHLLLKDV